MKYILSFSLFESCDNVVDKSGQKVHYKDNVEAVPFTYYPEIHRIFFGKFGDTHLTSRKVAKYQIGRTADAKNVMEGRLFFGPKIITFWQYPKDLTELKKILSLMDIGEDFFSTGWKIDIFLGESYRWDEDNKNYQLNDPQKLEYYKQVEFQEYSDEYGDYIIVPVGSYLGSQNPPIDAREAHILGPIEKRQKGVFHVPAGFGSHRTAWDGKNPLWWRQAKYQESRNNI